jgi:hypothetical protein
MATNPKVKRIWIKQEKRIVRLLYRKGLLDGFKLRDLYWAEHHWFRGKKYKSKNTKYKYPIYMPEVHYCTTDYWGEADEHSVVSTILDHLYWINVDSGDLDRTEYEFPKSTFNWSMSREQLINYLSKLPTKVNNNKINKILRTKNIDE